MDDKERRNMDKEELKIERRVDMAVEMARMSDKIAGLTKTTDACSDDRKALFKRIRQMDVQISRLETKQSVVTWVGGAVTLSFIGTMAKGLYSHFTKQH